MEKERMRSRERNIRGRDDVSGQEDLLKLLSVQIACSVCVHPLPRSRVCRTLLCSNEGTEHQHEFRTALALLWKAADDCSRSLFLSTVSSVALAVARVVKFPV